MSTQSSYDVIIVGTSPLAITEAVYQRKQGKSVLNIDNRSVAGGAWTTIKHEGIPSIEIGCHIWEIEKSASDFLEKFFHLDLRPLSPQPRIIKKGFSIPYDWKMNLSTSKYLFSKGIRFQFKTLKAGMKSPDRRFSLVPGKYLYPRGGANELHQRVLEKIAEHELEIVLNQSVDTVEIKKDNVEISSGGKTISCKSIVLTSLSSIKKITFEDGSEIFPETKQIDYIHVHLLFNGAIPKQFSYERWMDDATIHRVSDMTSQVSNQLNSGEKLVCVGIHAKAYHSSTHPELLNVISARLIDRKLISSSAKLVAHGFNVFPSFYNPPHVLAQLEEKSNGKLRVLRSTSFTYSFFNQMDRYLTLTSK